MPLYTKDDMVGQRVSVTDYFLVKVRHSLKKKTGTIVGVYLNEYWHPYTYRAYHIQFDDGTCGTFKPQQCKSA